MIEIKPDTNIEDHSLAYQLILELKNSSRRWFIAFVIVLGLWFGTIGVFIWYISLPIEETAFYEQWIDEIEDSDNMKQMIITEGGYNGESETECNESEEARE